jgi:hypothetical protein
MAPSDECWTHELRYPIAMLGEVRSVLIDEFGQSWEQRFDFDLGVVFVCVKCSELDALFLSTVLPPLFIDKVG